MTHEELVKKIGVALFEEHGIKNRVPDYNSLARAAIAAVAEALKEPTPEMIEANLSAPIKNCDASIADMLSEEWHAMLAASPLYPNEAAK